MDMENGLARVCIGILHDSEATFVHAPFAGNRRRNPENVANEGIINRCKVKGINDMLLRNEEEMERRNRADILDGD